MEVQHQPNTLVAPHERGEQIDFDPLSLAHEMTVTGDTIFPLDDFDNPTQLQSGLEDRNGLAQDMSASARNTMQSVDVEADVSETQQAANILANGIHMTSEELDHNRTLTEAAQNKINDIRGDMERDMAEIRARWGDRIHHGGDADEDLNPETEEQVTFPAFAKLVFRDGDYFLRSHTLLLGRNVDFYKDWKRQNKERREANKDLLSYRKEPSQPSHGGDNDHQLQGSSSNQSLEGRPAPPSTASEQGGAVYYSNRDNENSSGWQYSRRKRSSMQHSKSSSTHSINPWNLHPQNPDADLDVDPLDEDGNPTNRTFAWLPVHPLKKDDIAYISREHLLIRYNFALGDWELVALANGVYVDKNLVPKGTSVPLAHNSWIRILSLAFHFKLPDHYAESDGISRGTWGSDVEDEVDEYLSDDDDDSVGPVGKLTGAFAEEDELDAAAQELEDDEEDDEDDEPAIRNRPKLKLTTRRPGKHEAKVGKAKDKGKQREKAGDSSIKNAKKETPLESSPEASKKPEKGKKPKVADAVTESSKPVQPPAPPQIEPGSYLAEIPIDQLPEKRKGPGRPPKNGFVSKRDHSLVVRKQKEYEKRGEEVPAYDTLVTMVRRETKAKEAAQKMANGGLPGGSSVVQSIETDSNILPRPSAGPTTQPSGQASGLPAESARKPSPKPKRTVKSPSPVAPKESYSEEELKKPTKTYYYIINDLLESHAEHQADLQELYHLIMKKYPYFKYGVEGTGWQSSVRHNLLQHKRFVEVGKSGKGKFWAIDANEPLEKEKKRRITPPPRPAGQPYMQQQGMGMATYGNPYAQNGAGQGQFPAGPQAGPNGSYYSPYNQGYHPQAQQGQGITYPRPSQQRGPHALQHQARPPPPPPNPYEALVNSIMQYRQEFLRPFMVNGQITQGKEQVFSEVLNYLSDAQQKDWSKAAMKEDYTEEQKMIYKALYEKFEAEHVRAKKEAEQQAQRQEQQRKQAQAQPLHQQTSANGQQTVGPLASGAVALQQQAGQPYSQVGTQPAVGPVANGVHAAAAHQADGQMVPGTQAAAVPAHAPQPIARPEPSPISTPASQAQSPAPLSAGVKRAAEDDGRADTEAKRLKNE